MRDNSGAQWKAGVAFALMFVLRKPQTARKAIFMTLWQGLLRPQFAFPLSHPLLVASPENYFTSSHSMFICLTCMHMQWFLNSHAPALPSPLLPHIWTPQGTSSNWYCCHPFPPSAHYHHPPSPASHSFPSCWNTSKIQYGIYDKTWKEN